MTVAFGETLYSRSFSGFLIVGLANALQAKDSNANAHIALRGMLFLWPCRVSL